MASIFKLIVDDRYFFISSNSINRQHDSLFQKVILNGHTDERIQIKNDDVYIDADYDCISYIVSYIRGYPLDFNISVDLKKKIHYDAKYFQLKQLISIFEDNDDNKMNISGGFNDADSMLFSYSDTTEESSLDSKGSDTSVDTENDNFENQFEEMLKLTSKEKEEFDNELKEIQRRQPIQSNELEKDVNTIDNEVIDADTLPLYSNDKYQINDFLNNLQAKFKGGDNMMMSKLSTDKNICQMIKDYNKTHFDLDSIDSIDSDTESYRGKNKKDKYFNI